MSATADRRPKVQPLDATTRIVRSPEPAQAETGGGLVLLSLENGKYFGLNATGQAIWELIAAPMSIAQIGRALEARFEVDADHARASAIAFVSRLIEEKVASRAS
jgi:hypothetical protein